MFPCCFRVSQFKTRYQSSCNRCLFVLNILFLLITLAWFIFGLIYSSVSLMEYFKDEEVLRLYGLITVSLFVLVIFVAIITCIGMKITLIASPKCWQVAGYGLLVLLVTIPYIPLAFGMGELSGMSKVDQNELCTFLELSPNQD